MTEKDTPSLVDVTQELLDAYCQERKERTMYDMAEAEAAIDLKLRARAAIARKRQAEESRDNLLDLVLSSDQAVSDKTIRGLVESIIEAAKLLDPDTGSEQGIVRAAIAVAREAPPLADTEPPPRISLLLDTVAALVAACRAVVAIEDKADVNTARSTARAALARYAADPAVIVATADALIASGNLEATP